MTEEQLTERERLRNVSAWNEKRKVLRKKEENLEQMTQTVKAFRKNVCEFRDCLYAIAPDRFNEDDLPLFTDETLTPAGYAEIKIDLDSGANTFNMLLQQVQERLKKNEFDAFVEYFLAEAQRYNLDAMV